VRCGASPQAAFRAGGLGCGLWVLVVGGVLALGWFVSWGVGVF